MKMFVAAVIISLGTIACDPPIVRAPAIERAPAPPVYGALDLGPADNHVVDPRFFDIFNAWFVSLGAVRTSATRRLPPLTPELQFAGSAEGRVAGVRPGTVRLQVFAREGTDVELVVFEDDDGANHPVRCDPADDEGWSACAVDVVIDGYPELLVGAYTEDGERGGIARPVVRRIEDANPAALTAGSAGQPLRPGVLERFQARQPPL